MCLLEGSLIEGTSEHRVLDGSVLLADTSDLHSCAHLVLLGHFHAENASTGNLSIGHHRFLGHGPGCVSGLLSTCALIGPVSGVLGDRTLLASSNDTAFLSIVVIDSENIGKTTRC